MEPASIAGYMAVSETVQESVGQGYPITVLLSPGWAGRGVSIGKEQQADYVNLEACRRDGLDVVRRPTEGYAVLHYPNDTTYGVVFPRKEIPEGYRTKRGFDDMILPVIARSLGRAGVSGAYDPFPERYGNVFVRDRKISGSAQNTDNKVAWLQHGLLIVRRHDVVDYTKYIQGENDLVKIQSQITSVEEEGGIADSNNLVAIMAEEFQRNFFERGIELKESPLSPEEIEYSRGMLKTKYEDEEWLHLGTGRKDDSGRVGCFVGWNAAS